MRRTIRSQRRRVGAVKRRCGCERTDALVVCRAAASLAVSAREVGGDERRVGQLRQRQRGREEEGRASRLQRRGGIYRGKLQRARALSGGVGARRRGERTGSSSSSALHSGCLASSAAASPPAGWSQLLSLARSVGPAPRSGMRVGGRTTGKKRVRQVSSQTARSLRGRVGGRHARVRGARTQQAASACRRCAAAGAHSQGAPRPGRRRERRRPRPPHMAEKRAEIYTYESAWPIYAANWSVRGNSRSRAARRAPAGAFGCGTAPPTSPCARPRRLVAARLAPTACQLPRSGLLRAARLWRRREAQPAQN